MKKLFSLFITSAFMLFTTVIYAQVVVSGMVVDSNNEQALIGANVVVKGTTIGASTGLDGSFQFNVSKAELSSNPILEVTYLGYIDLEIPITNDLIESEKIDVEALLESSDIALSEIEVTSSGQVQVYVLAILYSAWPPTLPPCPKRICWELILA